MDVERIFGKKTIARSTTAAIWSQTSDGVDLGQLFGLYHHVGRRKVLGFETGAEGFTDPRPVVDRYLARISYRQSVYRPWLYMGIEPGADFPPGS